MPVILKEIGSIKTNYLTSVENIFFLIICLKSMTVCVRDRPPCILYPSFFKSEYNIQQRTEVFFNSVHSLKALYYIGRKRSCILVTLNKLFTLLDNIDRII